MCRGLPLEGLGVAPSRAQQVAGSARPPQFDDTFLQYTFKVVSCDKNYRHDYATCPFSHPGESSERRHPSTYLPFMCGSTQHSTDLKEKCPFGTACKYAHGHFELWLHPGRFRTKMCSLGENCRRAVCFFAHNRQELRVTPYSKLDTAAATATEQLAQMQREGMLCPSLEAVSKASSACSSSDAVDLKAASTFSSPCGSEVAYNLQRGSPCSSAAAVDEFGGLTAGMVLNNQAAMLEMQLQSNALALAAADASSAVADVTAAAVSTAPGLWLAGSTGMLQQQMPVAAGPGTLGLLPQQLVMVDANHQLLAHNMGALQPTAAMSAASDLWMVPTIPPTASRLVGQWPANNMLAQQQITGFSAGLTSGTPIQCLAAPSMANAPGLDQWLQMDNMYGAPQGLNRAPTGCSIHHQKQHPAATARVAQLLSGLPDQTVQHLLGMLTVEPQA